MLSHYYVRLGLFGQVGRLVADRSEAYTEGRRAVCRTDRGLEIGEVLRRVGNRPTATDAPQSDGQLLRHVTPEDDLILARLEQHRAQAYDDCVKLLADRSVEATLVDVEQLFDGQSLFFYFLGEVTPQIDQLTRELAETYEAKVQFREFVDAVNRGCGPDCGTESASGCGTTGCSSCAIADACRTREVLSTPANGSIDER